MYENDLSFHMLTYILKDEFISIPNRKQNESYEIAKLSIMLIANILKLLMNVFENIL